MLMQQQQQYKQQPYLNQAQNMQQFQPQNTSQNIPQQQFQPQNQSQNKTPEQPKLKLVFKSPNSTAPSPTGTSSPTKFPAKSHDMEEDVKDPNMGTQPGIPRQNIPMQNLQQHQQQYQVPSHMHQHQQRMPQQNFGIPMGVGYNGGISAPQQIPAKNGNDDDEMDDEDEDGDDDTPNQMAPPGQNSWNMPTQQQHLQQQIPAQRPQFSPQQFSGNPMMYIPNNNNQGQQINMYQQPPLTQQQFQQQRTTQQFLKQ
jgi:hypothetical protein